MIIQIGFTFPSRFVIISSRKERNKVPTFSPSSFIMTSVRYNLFTRFYRFFLCQNFSEQVGDVAQSVERSLCMR